MEGGSSGDRAKRTAAARVLSLLEAFSRGGGALTLTEISRIADLSLTTTHRLVHEVMDWGGVELDDTGHYRLSSKILHLASSSTEAMRLRERAQPHLMELHRRAGLTVQLAARDGLDVMYLEALRAHPNYTGENKMGGRLRLHVVATGLVLLAAEDESFVSEYLAAPLKRYTAATPAAPLVLRRALQEVRARGYAIADRFIAEGAGSVAAPVVGIDGSVCAAVGVTYATARRDPRSLVDPVRLTARRISEALQRKPPVDRRTMVFNRRHAGLG